MDYEAEEGARFEYALRGEREIQLRGDGVAHPSSLVGNAQLFTPYEEVTHVAATRRFLWLATERSVHLFPRRAFLDPGAPDAFVASLRALLEHRQGGRAQLAEMAAIDERARLGRPRWLAVLILALCAGIAWLGSGGAALRLYEASYFSAPLFLAGEVWRAIASVFVHATGWHALENLVALVPLGFLLESAIGRSRAVLVLAASGAGACALAGAVSPSGLVGSSGLPFGAAAALLWLDWNRAHELPAWGRLPRFWLLAFLALQALIFLASPSPSWAPHLGGFAGGAAGATLVSLRAWQGMRADRAFARAAALVAFCALLALGRVARDVRFDPDYLARHAARMATLPGVAPEDLNNLAWTIATTHEPARAELEAALPVAERAVRDTQQKEGQILDTLAELQFQLGRREDAIATIDLALAAPCTPWSTVLPELCLAFEAYYREQRERFAGERPATPRPADPMLRLREFLPRKDGDAPKPAPVPRVPADALTI
jgi:membrane associated rhomboid family serine protease